jgi:hypothetical protein
LPLRRLLDALANLESAIPTATLPIMNNAGLFRASRCVSPISSSMLRPRTVSAKFLMPPAS